jgi:hypothetical protein
MGYIGPLALILGALVCLSGFIIGKKPEAKQLFDKIAPYQGFLGVGLLAWGIWDLIHNVLEDFIGDKSRFGVLWSGSEKFMASTLLGYIVCEILIGFMLGFGLIATWIPGEGAAEKKAVLVQKKLLAFALPIGAVGIVLAILWLIKMPKDY